MLCIAVNNGHHMLDCYYQDLAMIYQLENYVLKHYYQKNYQLDWRVTNLSVITFQLDLIWSYHLPARKKATYLLNL